MEMKDILEVLAYLLLLLQRGFQEDVCASEVTFLSSVSRDDGYCRSRIVEGRINLK